MQTTLETWASAPSGSGPRPSFCWRPDFSWSDNTSKATSTRATPGRSPTAWRTAFSKWLRMGQPGVVSETVTATVPSARASIDRTISSSTIERRSSGSMTAVRAWRISSRVGMGSILANAPPCPVAGSGPGRAPGRRTVRRGERSAALRDPRDPLGHADGDLRASGDAALHEVADLGADEAGLGADVAAAGDHAAAQGAEVALHPGAGA